MWKKKIVHKKTRKNLHTTATAGTMVGKWVVCVFLFCVLHFRRGDTVLWCSSFKCRKKGEGGTRPSTWSIRLGCSMSLGLVGKSKGGTKENVAI